MARVNTLLSYFLLLCITTTPHSLQAEPHTTDLVTTTCSHTPDPAICESALRSDPRSSTVADTEGLILIMIDVVKARFTDSVHYAEEMGRKTRDPDVKRAFGDCVRVYRVVVEANVDVAVSAVKLGDPKFGEQAMVDSGNEAEACLSGFPAGKARGQLAGRTKKLHGVSNVAASLIKTLE